MGGVPLKQLNDGNTMPGFGFGVWNLADGPEVFEAVTAALRSGYRLIDTARIYGNEKGVGEAIRQSGVPREEIFLTTKVWNSDQGYDSTLEAFDNSLDRLSLDYIDLYLIHWPATGRRHESWKALEEIKRSGRAKSIGVSNYLVGHLKELLERSDTVPAVNQIEFHPFVYLEQKPVLEFCAQHGIAVEAYSPLARGRRMDDRSLEEIAQKTNKSLAQVMLRWAIQHGTIPIPKSAHTERIKENIDIFDFELTGSDMEVINALSR
jgi:diketogulonate reductase-like aldo/keto reductase